MFLIFASPSAECRAKAFPSPIVEPPPTETCVQRRGELELELSRRKSPHRKASTHAAIHVEFLGSGERFLRDVDRSMHGRVRVDTDGEITLRT